MFNFRKNVIIFIPFQVSTKVKIIPEFNDIVYQNIVDDIIKPKKHPGILKMHPPEIPEKLFNAIKYVTRGMPVYLKM